MHSPAATETKNALPLCVDLDGTLLKTDLIWESLVCLLKRNPLYVFPALFWWTRGRAFLKAQVAARAQPDPAILPYHRAFVDYLRDQRQQGRTIILATASDGSLAEQVARHVGVFSEVLASDGKTNLRGKNKGACLAEKFGPRGFDYAGNSRVDLPVWEQARHAIVVGASPGLAQRAGERAELGPVFEPRPNPVHALIQALRPHQWVKNLIIFVPLLTAHQLLVRAKLTEAVLAFIAFCLCASAVYIVNDLLDLEADRHHPTKRFRPFAAADLPLPVGLLLAPVLFAASAVLACCLPLGFGAVLGVYVLLTTSYSWRLKEIALVDVFCLAGLYTIRLVAGHEASRVEYSSWLLVFSMFIFLSLALVKRFTELTGARQQRKTDLKGRGYLSSDLELVASLGAGSGYLAVLVLALYVNSPDVLRLYAHPTLLLLVCPLLLYWISRIWLRAHRGQMHDDPIVFALKDPVSYLVGALSLLVVWLATGH